MENFTYFAASDIHGNIEALDEIIRLAEKEKADRIFIAGDLCPGDWLSRRKASILKCRMDGT